MVSLDGKCLVLRKSDSSDFSFMVTSLSYLPISHEDILLCFLLEAL